MTLTDLAVQIYENDLRIEAVHFVGVELSSDTIDFLKNNDLLDLYRPEETGDIEDWDGYEYSDEDLAHEFAQEHLGRIVVQFATPIKEYHSKTSCSYSWGHYTTKTLVVDSIESAFDTAKAWAKRVDADARKKFKPKKKKASNKRKKS